MHNQPTGQVDSPHAPTIANVCADQTKERFTFKMVDIPVMVVFWVLVAIVFLQFFTRYVLNDSLGWTEEIARFLLILLGFIGSVTVVRNGGHIALEFSYRFIPSQCSKALMVFSQIACSCFYGYCAYLSWQVAMRINQTLVSIPLPKSVIYWVICVCCAAMALHSLMWLYTRITQHHITLANNLNN